MTSIVLEKMSRSVVNSMRILVSQLLESVNTIVAVDHQNLLEQDRFLVENVFEIFNEKVLLDDIGIDG